jgi:hypothetical protein
MWRREEERMEEEMEERRGFIRRKILAIKQY